jgi:hypothetical protein
MAAMIWGVAGILLSVTDWKALLIIVVSILVSVLIISGLWISVSQSKGRLREPLKRQPTRDI